MYSKLGFVGLSYLAGIFLSAFVGVPFCFLFAMILLGIAVIFIILKKFDISLLIFTVTISMAVYGLFNVYNYMPLMQTIDKTIVIDGTVVKESSAKSNNVSYVIQTEINGIPTKVSFYGADCGASYNDHISFTGKVNAPVDNVIFADKSYAFANGIFLDVTATSDVKVTKSKDFSLVKLINNYSEYINTNMRANISGEAGELISALFFGDKTGLSYTLKDNIKRSGVAHLTAVSGVHLTIISHIFMLILNLFISKRKWYIKYAALTVLIALFMVFFKMSASVIRSGIMLFIYYGAYAFMRKPNTLNSIGIAMLLILIPSPFAAFDVGFLLSVSGTVGVGVVSPIVCKAFKDSRFRSVLELFVGTICATFCTLPFVTIFFGGISIVSPITNILLQPFFMIILACLLIFTLLGGYGGALLLVAGVASTVSTNIINFCGNLKYSYFPIDYAFSLALIIFSFLFTIVIHRMYSSSKKTLGTIFASIFAFVLCIGCYNWLNKENTKLNVISDGNDACIFMENGIHSLAIVTNDSPALYKKLDEEISLNFIDNLDLLILANSKNNAVQYYDKINATKKVFPGSDELEFIISPDIKVTKVNDEYKVDFNNVSLSTYSLKSKNMDVSQSDFAVYYNNSKKGYEMFALQNIFTSKKQTNVPSGCKNAYYEKTEFQITSDHKIISN